MDFLTYVNANLSPDLYGELNSLFTDQWEEFRLSVTYVGDADMTRQDKRSARTIQVGFDPLVQVLRMRRARIERERQDMQILLMDQSDILSQISASAKAKRLIDAELNRRSQSQRS